MIQRPEDKIMSLDFQRMRSVGTAAGRFVGETSIADRTSHQKGGVGCAVHVHGAWLGEQRAIISEATTH